VTNRWLTAEAMQIILASNNPKKLLELQTLLAVPALQWRTQGELGIPECPEPHVTFVENALAKARHAAHQAARSGAPMGHTAALADDSGLCVQALGGMPGVRSARWAQDHGVSVEGMSRQHIDQANNACLLTHMQAHTQREAHFMCVLVAVRHADDPEPLVAQGHWPGRLLEVAAGEAGFGYDPLLFIDSENCAVAQLPPARKNALSHRAMACQTMRQLMAARWGLAV
jgi:XTP/dITP diphosphohydrolase